MGSRGFGPAGMQGRQELVLAELRDGDETRRVVAAWGPSLAVVETTSGPVTMVAYGVPRHGHKLLCDAGELARALGAPEGAAGEALQRFFAGKDELAGEAELARVAEPAQLSDLMDVLDQYGVRYTYAAWSGGGDAVLRRC